MAADTSSSQGVANFQCSYFMGLMAIGADRCLNVCIPNGIFIDLGLTMHTGRISFEYIFMAFLAWQVCYCLVIRHGFNRMGTMATRAYRGLGAALGNHRGMDAALVLFVFFPVALTATVVHLNGIFPFAIDGDVGAF